MLWEGKTEMNEAFVEFMEDMKLWCIAEQRDGTKTMDFEDFVKQEGFSMEELKKLAESIELE